jgi:ABC-2 type transport system ATP-binding protein
MQENIIEVKNLTKRFKDFVAVDDVSFNVKKGEIFGFLGPNGAGKSTTIRILTTLLRPTKGKVSVCGFDVVKKSDEVRKHIGLVAEKIILYDRLTAKENLYFFGKINKIPKNLIEKRTEKWLKRLHMKEWENHLVGTFSTGMKQRVNIARALLGEPEVLFLDEPTLGLDPQTTRLIREFIEELNRHNTTVVLTTHDMFEAESLSNRVAIIDHGKIVALDTVDNLKNMVKGVKNPNLEDVFLEITGKEIRDKADLKLRPGHRPGPAGRKASSRIR